MTNTIRLQQKRIHSKNYDIVLLNKNRSQNSTPNALIGKLYKKKNTCCINVAYLKNSLSLGAQYTRSIQQLLLKFNILNMYEK